MPPTAQDLGAAIRLACLEARVTQKQVAEATGKDQTTISAWMKGENWPALASLPTIDGLCGRPAGHILRLAGFVVDGDARDAIMADTRISIETRQSIVAIYDELLTRADAQS